MQISSDILYKPLCKLDIPKKKYQSTQQYLNKHFEELLSCFYSMRSQVYDKTLVELKGIDEKSVLTILPTQFTVDFKGKFAIIKAKIPR